MACCTQSCRARRSAKSRSGASTKSPASTPALSAATACSRWLRVSSSGCCSTCPPCPMREAACAQAASRMGQGGHVLQQPLDDTRSHLEQAVAALKAGVEAGDFVEAPERLFALRLALHDCVQQAMQLGLQTAGGRAYSLDGDDGFARRWRESAFIPIVTPSVIQLRAELQKLQKLGA